MSASNSVQTGSTVCSQASDRNSSRVGRRSNSIIASPRCAEAAIEACALAGVASALADLVDEEQQHVGVAVVRRLTDILVVTARVALAPDLLAAAAPVDHPTFVQRHLQ